MPTKTHKQLEPRNGSVYIAVTGVAMIISLIGLTAIHLSRLELKTTASMQDQSYARILAQSSVEIALANIEEYSDWRTRFSSGVEVSVTPNINFDTLYFKFIDNIDGNLGNDTTEPVEIQGIGRYGGATVVYSVDYAASVTSEQQVTPPALRNFEPGSSNWGSLTIDGSNWVGQYFLPSLPAGTTNWTVTGVEVQMAKSGAASGTLDVSLHLPDGSLLPGTLIETIAVPESTLPISAGTFHEFTFGSATGLNPAVGLCLTLTTVSPQASELDFESSGVAAADAHMLTSNGGGWTPAPSQSLYYRIRGFYTTASGSGPFTITPGSWQQTQAP